LQACWRYCIVNDNYAGKISQVEFRWFTLLPVILSLPGAAGLIYAGISFLNGGESTRNIKAIIFSGVPGAIFFFASPGGCLKSNETDNSREGGKT